MSLEKKEKKSILQMDVGDIFKAFKKKKQNKKDEKKESHKVKKVISKKAVSIDIGSENTKVVVGRYYKNKVTIEKAFEFKTPIGIIDDGHIKNIDELGMTLNDNLALHKVKADNIIFTTNSTSIINRTIVVPKVTEEEIESVIRYEVQQYLPIKLEEHMVQYNILGEKIVDGKEKLEVLIVVYPNKMIFSYAELVNILGGKPYALDVNYNSQRKAYYVMNPEINETILSMDIGEESIDLTVIKNNELILMKRINSGGKYLNSQIAKTMGISLENAETQKRENCNLMSRDEGSLEHCVRDVVDMWFDEAIRIIKYYKSKNTHSTIDKIYLCGGSSNIKGLERYIAAKLDLRAKILQENSNIEFKKGVEEVKVSEYINAIGALIRL
ncbi:pilus assembly protein PilM [Clostridium sp. B9]|uniref:pilus assembly protein PilM n=1 Tax=Clostridium sp. B9 TaxID=3423224 RepID=UPI003D2EE04D